MEVAASIVGLLAVGGKILQSLQEFVSTCKDAPETAKAIRDEVGAFRWALHKLAPYIRQSSKITPLGRSSTDVDQLKITLASCVDTFSQTHKLLDRLAPSNQERMDYLGRMRWSLAEGNLSKLHSRIEKHKTTLILLLAIWTSESCAQTENNVDSLSDLLTNIMAPGREMEPLSLPFKPPSPGPSDGDSRPDTISNDDCSIHTISTVKSLGVMSKRSLLSKLINTRPYRNPEVFADSRFSVSTSQRGTSWSVFTGGSNTSVFSLDYTGLGSGGTLAEEPDLCQVPLPLHTNLLYNPLWYPPSASSTTQANSVSSGRKTTLALGRKRPSTVGEALAVMAAGLYSSSTTYDDFHDTYRKSLQDACSKGDLTRIGTLFGCEMEIRRLHPEFPEGGTKNMISDCIRVTYNGTSALDLAVKAGDQVIAEMILDRGADIDKLNSWGATALYTAVRNGNRPMVEYLLDRGADINKADIFNPTALVRAAEAKDQQMVECLLDRGADINSAGRLALVTAVEAKDQQMVECLLDRGADINSAGRLALVVAIRAKDQQMVEYLLDRGVGINTAGVYNRTALFTAAEAKDQQMVECLLDRGADVNSAGRLALVTAVGAKDQQMVEYLLDRGADINKASLFSQTALVTAVRAKVQQMVEYLLDRGADINSAGRLALVTAVEAKDQQMVECLLDRGADINKVNEWGKTALYTAVDANNQQMVEMLLNRGADINQCDEYLPLHCAIVRHDRAVLQMLLDRGADPNMSSGQLNPALHVALNQYDRHAMVEMLLEGGLDINILNGDGEAALHIAAKRTDHGMVNMLLDRGAHINITDKHRKTALDLVNDSLFSPQSSTRDTKPAQNLRDILLARGAKSGSELDT